MFFNSSKVCWVILNAPYKGPFFFSAKFFSICRFRYGKQQRRINSAVDCNLSIFFFLVSCPVLANCQIPGFFPCYLCGNIVICINSKFCEKCSNTDLRVSAKLPPEPNRCGLIAFSECERACPYFYIHQGASSEPGLPVTLSFISSLVDKSSNMTLRSTSKYLSKSSRRIQL